MELFNTSQALVIALIVLSTLLIAQVFDLSRLRGRSRGHSVAKGKDVYHSRTYRVQGVPIEWDKERLRSFLVEAGVSATPVVQSLARESHNRSSTATVIFQDSAAILRVQLPEVLTVSTPERPMYVELDTQFLGLTTLYSPLPDDHQIDIIAIPGLGGHALGSFKERDGEYVWLRDSLPFDMTKNNHHRPISRVMTYGYESSLADSDNVQTLEDLSIGFIEVLFHLSRLSRRKTMFIIAHSLGGLIIKQSLIDLERSNREDYKALAEMIAGLFFFGVPHDGMDIQALIPMVGDGPNRFLVESINRLNPQVLNSQQRDFREFGLDGSREIVCFYETVRSPTAERNPNGTWSLTGPPALLVTKSSATMDHRQVLICAIARTHQNMVKFKAHDPEYNRVIGLFHQALESVSSNSGDFMPSEEKRMALWCANRTNPSRKPRKLVSIPADCFICLHEGDLDQDFPGRRFWYRENVEKNGYPSCVTVGQHILTKSTRPVGDKIITCRRICNLQIRGRVKWIDPGDYYVVWLLWLLAGNECPSSSQGVSTGWIPTSSPSNTVCERSFPSGHSPDTKDSGWFYPWGLRCSAGQAKNPDNFLEEGVDVDQYPCIPDQLLCAGYQELSISTGLWNTLRNTGWCEVKGPKVTVRSDGELYLVISKDFERKWVGGISFGGIKLVPT